ncbi:S-layer homology domain-containing protein [Pseudobacillus wudalianchiensis]|nr:S-layer homology domain-containing protein [Bacillus wudalianchiensis]OCA88883.1 hypothetical protein A8F95_05485 [Bacillus wudalianchiensis]
MAYQLKPYRKFLATAATAALVATAVSPAYAASFTDVSSNYKEAVDYLVSNKITDGISAAQFGTDLTIKRVDAAVMLAKALKLKVESVKDSGFTDVPTRAKAYVDTLKAAGIVDGKTAKTFDSEKNITRGEMAIMLAKAYKITGDKANLPFKDVAPRYQDSVAALFDHKITSGKLNGIFGIDQAIKRGEFAVFLYKLSKVEKEEPVVTTANVLNEADLLAALKNGKITKIVLEANITSSAIPVISRNVEVDLNGKTLVGNLQYNLPDETESITLSS